MNGIECKQYYNSFLVDKFKHLTHYDDYFEASDDEGEGEAKYPREEEVIAEAEKLLFPHSRQRSYHCYADQIPFVIDMILKGVKIARIKEITTIPESTLRGWRSKLKADKDWSPLIRKRKQKYFTVQESADLYAEVTETMTDARFDVHNFRAICIRHFNNSGTKLEFDIRRMYKKGLVPHH